jgi:PhnB protein
MAKKMGTKKKKKSSAIKKMASQKPKKRAIKKITAKRKKKVLAIPKGYHSITPYLIINNAANAIDFYKKAFGAKEVMRMEHPDGKIVHAELKIGDAKIMLSDESTEKNARSPQALGGSPVGIHFYTKNVDGIVDKAVSAGATLAKPIENMFYGDRCGTLQDPYGHKWHVSTHIEDVSTAKMKKRVAAFFDENC